MRRALTIAIFLLGAASAAQASHFTMMYHDTIRPHGHPRSASIYNASLNACYARTGISRSVADTPAFKRCMLAKGYRWQYTKLVRDPPTVSRQQLDNDDLTKRNEDESNASRARDDEQRRNDDAAREMQEIQNTQDAANAAAAAAASQP